MPENQNMQKTSDNEAMLQEIVQNTEMGKNTLDELMGLTYDQKLKDEMMRQKNEYRRLNAIFFMPRMSIIDVSSLQALL